MKDVEEERVVQRPVVDLAIPSLQEDTGYKDKVQKGTVENGPSYKHVGAEVVPN